MFKKLLTLAAVGALCLNAQAKEIVDGYVDFSKEESLKIYGWGAPGSATIKDGCLYYQSDAETDVPWDVQFSPLGDMEIEEGVTYNVSMEIKGTPEGDVFNWAFGGVDHYYQLHYTEEFSVYECEVECVKEGDSNKIWLQIGNIVGEMWISWIKVTHEGKDSEGVEPEWEDNLTNGDAEGEYGDVPCMISKVFTGSGKDEFFETDIETEGDNHVFVIHAKAVEPPLLWEEAGEQWGQKHEAGDPKPDNAWQNQIWIQAPAAWADGEITRLSFKYKASKAVNTDMQWHGTPGSYIGGFGSLKFGTDWQTYEKQVTISGTGIQTLAFNLGAEIYNEDIDFYFDDVKWETMKLDEGWFVAGDFNDWNYGAAVEFEEDGTDYVVTIGEDTPASQIQISTKRGQDKAFKNAAILPQVPEGEEELWTEEFYAAPGDVWYDYKPTPGKKITLPQPGVWTITVDTEYNQVCFDTEMVLSSIKGVSVENAPAVYYNLQGVQVNNPANGIFIVKKGNKVSKQVIR